MNGDGIKDDKDSQKNKNTSYSDDSEKDVGSKRALQVWDASTNAAVRRAFAHRTSDGQMMTKGEKVAEILVSLHDGKVFENEDGINGGGAGIGGGENEEDNSWESMEE